MAGNRIPSSSPDLVKKNIHRLKQLFPEISGGGSPEDKIDFDILKTLLGEEIDDRNERYRFEWHGKKDSLLGSQQPSKGTLRPDKESSKNFDTTENLYIEGDNLEVLKLLQKSYNDKVKMIYIDPPYNTGNDFVYEDDFKDNIQNYLEQTGQVDGEGKKLSTNTETSGRKHTNWLNMMYPRLKLARNLLADDGVIFISIDDAEQERLKMICNEILGESNKIGELIRNTNSSKNQALFLSTSHDYCLVYGKDINKLSEKHGENKWSVPKNNVKEYVDKVNHLEKQGLSKEQITLELKQLSKYPRFMDFENYWYFDERGLYRKGDLGGVRNGNMTPILNPLTGKNDPIPPGGFRYNQDKIQSLIRDDRIHFHADGSLPTVKRYLSENMNQRPKAIMSDDQRPDDRLMKLFNTPFEHPKQLAFIERIISIVDSDSIILDFFSGSATTSHATMQLNAKDNGNRKFIMVQLPEETEEKSEAYKAGYHNICEIGKERIRRAGEKIIEEHPDAADKLDIGFKVLKLDKSNIREWNVDFEELKGQLSSYDNMFVPGRSELDVVYEIMLKYGLELTYPINTFQVEDKNVYDIAFGNLFICLDENIDTAIAQAIIDKRNDYGIETSSVVFADHGFRGNDSEKLNCFKLLQDAGYQNEQLMTI